jgi:hypothetical protein
MKKAKLDTTPQQVPWRTSQRESRFLKPPDSFDWGVVHPTLRKRQNRTSFILACGKPPFRRLHPLSFILHPSSFILHPLSGLLLAGLVSCGNISQYGMSAIGANVTPIRTLTKQQNNSTVYVQGKVEKVVPLLQQRAYQINDSTGKIWVVTNQTSWRENEQVVVKGKLRYKSIPLAGKEFGEVYVQEQ